MWLFIEGLLLLAAGYLFYGRYIEHQLLPDRRQTPALRRADGVDFMVMPKWKNMLIQLLNIAGIGPVIGVILGIKFGEIVFFLIPVGNIIGGAVHDYVSGMMSLRNNGANLPRLMKKYMGRGYYRFFNVFVTLLLLLVVAVFINVPAKLSAGIAASATGNTSGMSVLLPGGISCFWIAVGVIFLYYICATLFPVDKIIGTLYPVFGGVLLLSSLAILVCIFRFLVIDPEILLATAGFKANMFTAANNNPVIPCLFVTIACGIISGFHATQSPIVARTMGSEKESRATFYGMMILEGGIAMIWAAAAMIIYNRNPELMLGDGVKTLRIIAESFLGTWPGYFTVAGVIILAITSGDTAMRSLRLSVAEALNLKQKKISGRLLVCVPLIAVISVLLWWSNRDAKSFGYLWNYFAWGNQLLAASTLMAGTVYLYLKQKNYFVCLLPGLFMCFIIICFILWTSPEHSGPYGFGLELPVAEAIAAAGALVFGIWTLRRAAKLRAQGVDQHR